jgi:hypothetical protein
MQLSHALGAGIALVAIGWFFATAPGSPAAPLPAAPPIAPPVANGHYVLVVEGDRDHLGITAAAGKEAPWAGVPKGLTSDWRLLIHDARGEVLADVPLDVTPFATRANDRGVRVQGCVVHDARIGMLVNAPAFAAAASYTFTRPGGAGERVVLGTATGDRVRELAGGGK